MNIDFDDLLGVHTLDAVDFHIENDEDYFMDDSTVCRFRLDGVVYEAKEDPEDGYRSSLKYIRIIEGWNPKNVFPACKVICSLRTESKRGYLLEEDDVLEFKDVETDRIILEIGTEGISDWYPGFVASFHPENMVINQNS